MRMPLIQFFEVLYFHLQEPGSAHRHNGVYQQANSSVQNSLTKAVRSFRILHQRKRSKSRIALNIPVLEILVVVQASLIAGNPVEITHINSVAALLVGEQCFIHLLTVPDADDLDGVIRFEQTGHSLRQGFDGASRCFLYQNIAAAAVLEGKQLTMFMAPVTPGKEAK